MLKSQGIPEEGRKIWCNVSTLEVAAKIPMEPNKIQSMKTWNNGELWGDQLHSHKFTGPLRAELPNFM